MNGFVRLVGENRAVEFLGIKLVGFNAENGKELLFTIALFVDIKVASATFKIAGLPPLRMRDAARPLDNNHQGASSI